MLGLLLGTGPVGVYSVAATLTEILWLVPMSIGNVLFHRVANGTATARALRALRLANLAFAVACALVLAVLGPAIVAAVFGPDFAGATTPLRVLCVAAVFIAAYHVDIVRVTATGALSLAGRVVGLGCLATVAASFALIAEHGVTGAAAASLLGYALLAGGTALAARRVGTPLARAERC